MLAECLRKIDKGRILKEDFGFCPQYLREMVPKHLLARRKPKDQKESQRSNLRS